MKDIKKSLLITMLVLITGLIILNVILFINLINRPKEVKIDGGSSRRSYLAQKSVGVKGALELGEMELEISGVADETGGNIKVDNIDSSINGFIIHVPEGAYDEVLNFDIYTTEIKQYSYSELIEPITPLITIDNSEIFANEALQITIPIKKADDEFAMGFYYDEETGKFEAIPFLSQTNDEIVLLSKHFSAIVISKEKVEVLRAYDVIDTGFYVGIDDIQVKNYGSIASQGGYCAGQTAAILYYYSKHINNVTGFTESLYGNFDNNGLSDTPSLWEDDANLIRLCSALQVRGKIDKAAIYKRELNYDDKLTFYAFIYALRVTGHPQMLGVYEGDDVPGHAILVYRITQDTMLVADPNFPGETRSIKLEKIADGTFKFSKYFSGSNAVEANTDSVLYDQFLFMGDFAYVDEQILSKYWNQMLNGEKVATDIFKDDSLEELLKVEVAIHEDADGNVTTAPLTEGITLTEYDTSTLGLNSEGLLMLRKASIAKLARITVYIGDTMFGELTTEWKKITTLKTGKNDIGIHVEIMNDEAEYHYFDFLRYSVIYGESSDVSLSDSPNPEPPQVADETERFVGTWVGSGESNMEDLYYTIPATMVLNQDGTGMVEATNMFADGDSYENYSSGEIVQWKLDTTFHDDNKTYIRIEMADHSDTQPFNYNVYYLEVLDDGSLLGDFSPDYIHYTKEN